MPSRPARFVSFLCKALRLPNLLTPKATECTSEGDGGDQRSRLFDIDEEGAGEPTPRCLPLSADDTMLTAVIGSDDGTLHGGCPPGGGEVDPLAWLVLCATLDFLARGFSMAAIRGRLPVGTADAAEPATEPVPTLCSAGDCCSRAEGLPDVDGATRGLLFSPLTVPIGCSCLGFGAAAFNAFTACSLAARCGACDMMWTDWRKRVEVPVLNHQQICNAM